MDTFYSPGLLFSIAWSDSMQLPAEIISSLSQYGTWSYSRLQALIECPYKHHLRYELKKKETPTEQTLYGSAVHLLLSRTNTNVFSFTEQLRRVAMELFLPRKLIEQLMKNKEKIDEAIKWVASIPGKKFHEHRFAVDKNLRACQFFDSNVFFRGVVDLLAVNENKISIIDFKTSVLSEKIIDYYKPQLVLYSWIYKNLLWQNAEIATGLYFIHENQFRCVSTENEEAWRTSSDLFNKAIELLGQKTPIPGTHCNYCGYRQESCDAWKAHNIS